MQILFRAGNSIWGFPGGSGGKESACNARDSCSIPAVRKIPLENGMAIHASILAWRTPWTEEPGRYSPWGHKQSDMIEQLTHKQNNSHFAL